MGERLGVEITERNVGSIKSKSERVTAWHELCEGKLVRYQVPVGNSVIDLSSTERNNGSSITTLIEVSGDKPCIAEKRDRKLKQIEDMKRSGLPFRLICCDEWKKWPDI